MAQIVQTQIKAYRHIPTMTNSHHGGFLSVMIMVGICQWQNPTIDEDDEELQLFNHLTQFNSFDISEVIVTEVMCGPRAICLFSDNCHLDICNPQKIILIFFKYQENKFEVVMDVLVEELVDKEVAKVVEQVNRKFTSVGQQKLSWRWSWMWCWMRLTRRWPRSRSWSRRSMKV